MKLYEFDVSRSMRVHWALREVGAEFESVIIDLTKGEHKTPEFLAINPYGKLPVLEDCGNYISESAAITTYIAEKYPEKKLIPEVQTIHRAQYYQWMCFCIAEMEPHLWSIRKHMIIYPKEKRSLSAIKLAKKEYIKAVSVIDKHLKDKEYIINDHFSAADIIICYDLFWAESLKLLVEFTALVEYKNRLQTRPAFPLHLINQGSSKLIY